jgi:hypothetical protein
MSTEENKPENTSKSARSSAIEPDSGQTSRFPPDDDAGRPGWFGVGVASLAAAAFGGLLGQGFGGNEDRTDAAPAELVGDVDAIAASQRAMEQRLLTLQARTEALAEVEPPVIETGPGEQRLETLGETVDGLLARIDILEAEAAMAATDVDPIIDPARPFALPDALVAEIDSINNRLSAIESADAEAEGIANPRVRNRAITQLEERVGALESAQVELAGLIEARKDAMERLAERMTAAEVALNSAPVDDAMAEELDGLRADLDRLRKEIAGLGNDAESGVSEPELAKPRAPDDAASTAPRDEPVAKPAEPEGEAAQTGEDVSEPEADPISLRPETIVEPPVLREAGTNDIGAAQEALSDIRRAAARGSRFAAAHAALTDALPGEPLVAELAGFARSGAPTMAELREQFAVLPVPETPAEVSGEDGWNWLRRVTDGGAAGAGEADSGTDELSTALKAAAVAVDGGDLAEAVGVLGRLDDGVLPEAAHDWLIAAQQRVALESLLDRLEDRLTNSDN